MVQLDYSILNFYTLILSNNVMKMEVEKKLFFTFGFLLFPICSSIVEVFGPGPPYVFDLIATIGILIWSHIALIFFCAVIHKTKSFTSGHKTKYFTKGLTISFLPSTVYSLCIATGVLPW